MEQLIIKTEDRRLKALEELRSLNSEILYIWGNGSYSRDIEDYLRTVGHYDGHIMFLVDDEYYQPGKDDVMSISVFLGGRDMDIDVPVVFGFYNYPAVQRKKKEHPELKHLYDFHFAVVNGKRLAWDAFLAKDRENEYRKTYGLLSNERSRRCMLLYLNAATAGEFHELFTECYDARDYFNQITEGLHVDTLIDCGAFNGDSIHDFVAVFPDYKRIIAVEPDVSNLQRLLERQKSENIRDLTTINKGLGSHECVLHFKANGESNSYLDDDGDVEIQITTLDEVSKDLRGDIFVKMDIEGSELEALHGAENLIRKKHPIMAICVYHNEEDLIEIPRYIHKIAGEGVYNYYLGFHGLDLAELVFYAIPKSAFGKTECSDQARLTGKCAYER